MHADGGRAHEEAEDKPQVEAGCEAACQTGEQVGDYQGDNNPQPAISVSQQSWKQFTFKHCLICTHLEIWVWDPRSRKNSSRIQGQKSTGSRIRIRNTAYTLKCKLSKEPIYECKLLQPKNIKKCSHLSPVSLRISFGKIWKRPNVMMRCHGENDFFN